MDFGDFLHLTHFLVQNHPYVSALFFLAQLGKHQLHMSSDVIEPVFWFVIPIIAHAFTDGSAKNLRSVHTADVLNVLSGVQDKNEA